jgi:hypothetical protein
MPLGLRTALPSDLTQALEHGQVDWADGSLLMRDLEVGLVLVEIELLNLDPRPRVVYRRVNGRRTVCLSLLPVVDPSVRVTIRWQDNSVRSPQRVDQDGRIRDRLVPAVLRRNSTYSGPILAAIGPGTSGCPSEVRTTWSTYEPLPNGGSHMRSSHLIRSRFGAARSGPACPKGEVLSV